MEVALVVTHACNLACSYCYTGEKKRVRMERDVADRALDFAFRRSGDEHLQIGFFGGEPMLEHDEVVRLGRAAVARAASEGRSLQLQMTTNGTLLSQQRLDELLDLRVHLALSVDGTATQHDAARSTKAGASSYAATFDALRRLVASGTPFDVISVVTPDNVASLSEGVRHLLDKGVTSLTLNIDYSAQWSSAAVSELERQYEYVAAITLAWWRRQQQGGNHNTARRSLRLEPLVSAMYARQAGKLPAPAGCRSGVQRLAIAPSGRLYGCARSVAEDDGRAALGTIDSWLQSTPPNHQRQQRSTSRPQGDARCNSCSANERCGRHCACACSEETGDPTTPGPVLCAHQHLLERLASKLHATLQADGHPDWRLPDDVQQAGHSPLQKISANVSTKVRHLPLLRNAQQPEPTSDTC